MPSPSAPMNDPRDSDAPASPGAPESAPLPGAGDDDLFDIGPEPWDTAAPPPAPPPEPEPAAIPNFVNAPRRAPAAEPPPREYGAGASPAAFEAGEAGHDIKRSAFAVYLLYLGTFILLVPAVVGAVIAYKSRDEGPAWLRSHYVFQIRTFWISVAATVATILGFPIGFGPVLFMALVVWVTLRCFVGMVRLHRGEPIYNPQTWMV